jgi:hypothetical protein
MAPLNDTIETHPQLQDLTLTKDDWQQLRDIKAGPKPFKDVTKYISQSAPTLYMFARLYFKLKTLLSETVQKKCEFARFDNNIVITAIEQAKFKFDKYYTLANRANVILL